nr:PREDICTED: uncharacterized protein LOC105662843 isoform X2 [Megachile rotundata]
MYKEDVKWDEYVVCVVLRGRVQNNKNVNSRKMSKRNNLIKIYRLVQGAGVKIHTIRMIGYSKAEITTKKKEEANGLLKRYGKGEGNVKAFLPRRMAFRKGVIYEWEDSIEELREEAMPGQGQYCMERMKKRRIIDGKVKQCYRCLRYGHYQAQCREDVKRCAICSDKYHGQCENKPRCVNCGGDHGSLARLSWVWQREAAIRKVMAYKNVEFETAKGIVARSTGDPELDRTGGIDDFAGSNGDFPTLVVKEKRETWEKKEAPIQREVELIKKLRQERYGDRSGLRRGEGERKATYSEVMRANEENREGGKQKEPEQEEARGNDDKGARRKEGEGWKQVKRGYKPACINEEADSIQMGNRYLCLECKKKTEEMKREGKIQILKRIPRDRYMVGEEPEGECDYEKLEWALNKDEMEKERRRVRREKQMNREWLVELEKRKEDEILEEIDLFLQRRQDRPLQLPKRDHSARRLTLMPLCTASTVDGQRRRNPNTAPVGLSFEPAPSV